MGHRAGFHNCLAAALAGVVVMAGTAFAESDKYFTAAKAYADAMIERGRDTYGEKHSPLFASVLNRKSMKINDFPDKDRNSFPGVHGVRSKDRSIKGANPQEDMELYELLYALTKLTGDKGYADAADAALEYFFKNCRSPGTGFPAWGEHLYWHLEDEKMGPRHDKPHEIVGEWPFWDACYRLAPDASFQVALAFWDHQIADKQTGNFNRHAAWHKHGPNRDVEFPRYAGQMIITWADAYARPENADQPRRDEMLTAIRVVMGRMKHNMGLTKTGYLPADSSLGLKVTWPNSIMELARCLDKARPLVPEDLAEEMRELALMQDRHVHQMPHTISEPKGGFATEVRTDNGEPYHKKRHDRAFSRTWTAGYGLSTHADIANRSYHRYLQLKDVQPELAQRYRTLIVAAAEHYLESDPRADKFLRPDAVAPAIELLLHTHDMTSEKRYLDRARHFADLGVQQFLDDASPLPKASNEHEHYEAITGGPRLMLLLLRLYQVENGKGDIAPPFVPAAGF